MVVGGGGGAAPAGGGGGGGGAGAGPAGRAGAGGGPPPPGTTGKPSGVQGASVVGDVLADEAGDEIVAVVVARLQAQGQRMAG